MPNQTAMDLAKQIVDDLKGAGYYADPAVLAPLFRGSDVPDAKAVEIAQAVITESLRHYGRSYLLSANSDTEAERVANLIRTRGID